MAEQPCPECEGRPAAAGEPRGQGRRAQHRRVHANVGAGGARSGSTTLEMTETERAIARLIVREISERLAFLDNVGIGYLSLGALGALALRRRGAADPAGDADRLQPGRRDVHPRRALDRAAPARQREADRDPRPPARPRQHGDRGRARRGHDARRRPPRRPRPGRRRARRLRDRRGHAGGGRQEPRLADRPVPLRQAPDRGARRSGASRAARCSSAAPASTT